MPESPAQSAPARDRLRVGSVPYLVGRPLDSGLELEPALAYERAVPAALVEKLRANELDVALVSSIELFRRDGYRYVDELAVAGRGAVRSVQLFLRKPLERVESIALDPASRTSAVLVQIECAARLARVPRLVELAAHSDPRAADADAWLRIGDAALRETLASDAPPTFNPSAAWTERTGLPFVFACWVVAPGVELGLRAQLFAAARARGRARTAELAREAAHAWRVDERACSAYLERECVHELDGATMRAALARFGAEAAALGACRADLAPRPVDGAVDTAVDVPVERARDAARLPR